MMKALVIFLAVIAAVAFGGVMVQRHNDEEAIRTHQFKVEMPAADVRRSLGEPLGIIPAKGTLETWVYPQVAIKLEEGRVIDSQTISPETSAAMVRRAASAVAAVAAHPAPANPLDPAPPRNVPPATVKPVYHSALDLPAHH